MLSPAGPRHWALGPKLTRKSKEQEIKEQWNCRLRKPGRSHQPPNPWLQLRFLPTLCKLFNSKTVGGR